MATQTLPQLKRNNSGRKCSVCYHTERQTINAFLSQGTFSLREISKMYEGTSHTSISRHAKNCLVLGLQSIRANSLLNQASAVLDEKTIVAEIILKRLNKSAHGFVYLIFADNGLTKIGLARNVKMRLDTLKTASPCHLTLLHSIKTNRAESLETELHINFASKRIRGEWFNLSNLEIASIIKKYGTEKQY